MTSYLPGLVVSTSFFKISILSVKSPSSASVAVTSALGSNVSPTVRVLSSALMIGAAFIGSILGFTVTVIVLT